MNEHELQLDSTLLHAIRQYALAITRVGVVSPVLACMDGHGGDIYVGSLNFHQGPCVLDRQLWRVAHEHNSG